MDTTTIGAKRSEPGERTIQKSLIWIAVVILNIISAYTTAKGAQLAWREGGTFSAVVVPWGLAIAISLILIFLTIEAGFRNFGISRYWVFGSYMLLASVSIFFNFNFIYSSMTSLEDEREVLLTLEKISASLRSEAKTSLRKSFKLDDLSSEVAQSHVNMEIERTRPDRPGKGQLWIGDMTKHETAKARHELALKRFEEVTKEIDAYTPSPVPQGTINNFDDAHRYVESRRQQIALMLSDLSVKYGVIFKLSDTDAALLRGQDRRDLWYSLRAIVTSVRRARSGSPDISTYKVFLALVFSLIIDLPIFLAIFISGQTNDAPKVPAPINTEQKRTLWESDDELWKRHTPADQSRTTSRWENSEELWGRKDG